MNQVFHIREKLLTLQLIVFNHTTLVVLVLTFYSYLDQGNILNNTVIFTNIALSH